MEIRAQRSMDNAQIYYERGLMADDQKKLIYADKKAENLALGGRFDIDEGLRDKTKEKFDQMSMS